MEKSFPALEKIFSRRVKTFSRHVKTFSRYGKKKSGHGRKIPFLVQNFTSMVKSFPCMVNVFPPALEKLNVARFARNIVKWDFLSDFSILWCFCYLFRCRNVRPLKSEVCLVLYLPCLWHLESQARISWEHFCPGIFCPIFVPSFHLSDVLPCLLCPKVHFGWLPKASTLRPPRLHYGWKTRPFWIVLQAAKIRETLEKSNWIKKNTVFEN